FARRGRAGFGRDCLCERGDGERWPAAPRGSEWAAAGCGNPDRGGLCGRNIGMAERQIDTKDPELVARLWNNIVLSLRLMLDHRVSGRAKLIPLLALLYMISPIDFLPEIAFGPLGAVDDMGVLLLALQLFINSAPKDVLRAYRGEAPLE